MQLGKLSSKEEVKTKRKSLLGGATQIQSYSYNNDNIVIEKPDTETVLKRAFKNTDQNKSLFILHMKKKYY